MLDDWIMKIKSKIEEVCDSSNIKLVDFGIFDENGLPIVNFESKILSSDKEGYEKLLSSNFNYSFPPSSNLKREISKIEKELKTLEELKIFKRELFVGFLRLFTPFRNI